MYVDLPDYIRVSKKRAISMIVGTLVLATVTITPLASSQATELPQTIATVKSSVVAIATFQKTRNPPTLFFGTGFAINDGLTIVTNAHVVAPQMDSEKSGTLGVLVGPDGAPDFRPATLVAMDKEHDLALLRIAGTPLPVLNFADSSLLKEGQDLVFTGFPLGMILGFHRATNRAMVSAITPVVQPAFNTRGLDAKVIVQLQKSAFRVVQLDGTAYPGNSGSPLYDPASGQVYGIVNMVFIKGLKESAISQPSGISYAIPGNYIRDLLNRTQK